jgi:hypothetical protein
VLLPPDLAVRSAEIALAAYGAVTVETEDIHALIVDDPDILWIGLRGTADFVALLRDAAAAYERNDPILGKTPDTFASDAEQLFWRLWPKLPLIKLIGITGHSKGASEAEDLAAMFGNAGRRPSWLGAFEPAPVGPLNGLITGLPGIATWRGIDTTHLLLRDPVPAAPEWRPHAYALTLLPWTGERPLDPLDYHSMDGVLNELKKLDAQLA